MNRVKMYSYRFASKFSIFSLTLHVIFVNYLAACAALEKPDRFIGNNNANSQIFFQEEVDYLICGIRNAEWFYLGKGQMSIAKLSMCKETFREIIKDKSDMKPLLYYIHPPNATVLYDVLIEISIQLSTYCNDKNDPVIQKQPPIFILEWLPTFSTNTVNKLELNQTLIPCFPLTSLVFLRYDDGEVGSNSTKFWEMYCVKENVLTFQPVIFKKNENSTNEIQLADLRNILSRRQNLQGVKLRVLARNDPKHLGEVRIKRENGTHKLESGLAVDYLRNLQFGLNFSVRVVLADTDTVLEDKFDITGKRLATGEAELILMIATYELSRLQWVSFLHPTSTSLVYVFFRQPPAALFRNIFIQPISPGIWLCLGLIWILIIISSWIIQKLNPKKDRNTCPKEILIFTIGALCQQSWPRFPSTVPMKILFTVTFLTSMTMFIAYSASIVSLGLQSSHRIVHTMDDLSDYAFILTGQFSSRQINSTRREFHVENRMSPPQRSHSRAFPPEMRIKPITNDEERNEIMKKLYDTGPSADHYAYTDMLTRFYLQMNALNFTDDDFCSLDYIEMKSKLYQVGMFIRKRSMYQEFINYRIILALERGVEDRLINNFVEQKVPCCEKMYDDDEVRSGPEIFTIVDGEMVYKILLSGACAALFLLGVEYFTNKFRNRMIDVQI